jgi:hypothetical protein
MHDPRFLSSGTEPTALSDAQREPPSAADGQSASASDWTGIAACDEGAGVPDVFGGHSEADASAMPYALADAGSTNANMSGASVDVDPPNANMLESEPPAISASLAASGNVHTGGARLAPRDAFYKMFFGEWRIEKIVAENLRFGKEDGADELIGRTVYYDADIFKNDDVVCSSEPDYWLTVIPPDKGLYHPYFPAFEDLGFEGSYVAIVHVFNISLYLGEPHYGGVVFVKDDSTLILYSMEAMYETKRVSYIPEYESSFSYASDNYNPYDGSARMAMRDGFYKIFFGEWRIERTIAENSRFGKEAGAEDLLGRKVCYQEDFVKNGDFVVTQAPFYSISLIPLCDTPYISGLPNFADIGMTGEYVAIVDAYYGAPELDEANFGGFFIVKDDSTLILYERGALHEAKRLSHVQTPMYFMH